MIAMREARLEGGEGCVGSSDGMKVQRVDVVDDACK